VGRSKVAAMAEEDEQRLVFFFVGTNVEDVDGEQSFRAV
jgi:hypothetical protein